MTNTSFFLRLKEERKRLKLTQAKAAELIGVKRETWSRYETGVLSLGSDTLAGLANIGADVQYILTGIPTTQGQLKAEGKLKVSAPYINAIEKFTEEDDGDTSRDNEIFTTKMTYQLSEDEWELIQMFRLLSLTDKMIAVQLINNAISKKMSYKCQIIGSLLF